MRENNRCAQAVDIEGLYSNDWEVAQIVSSSRRLIRLHPVSCRLPTYALLRGR